MTREEVKQAQEAMRKFHAATGTVPFNPELCRWAAHYTQEDARARQKATVEKIKRPLVAVGRFVLGCLKWLLCALVTIWAVYQYGFLGLFIVPMFFALAKAGVAFSNWVDHWARQPVSKDH